jgi:RTX calcium-binding nonapeptide repeat (4 copies)
MTMRLTTIEITSAPEPEFVDVAPVTSAPKPGLIDVASIDYVYGITSAPLAPNPILGTSGSYLSGTSADDDIQGFGGNDVLYGLAGNDSLDGGSGADYVGR